jgi:ligand-binding sensor domain-containing protein
MWFGTDGGLSNYDGKRFWSYRNSSFHALCVMGDQQGTLWFGTTTGIARFSHNDSTPRWLPALAAPLFPRPVRTIFEDRHHNVWIGSLDGVFVINPSGLIFQFDHLKELQKQHIQAIREDKEGRILIASYAGIFRYRLSDSVLVNREQIISGPVSSMAVLRNGDILAGFAHLHGVMRYRNGNWSTILGLESLGPDGFVNTLSEDEHGALWVGTAQGFSILDNKGKTIISKKQGLISTFINDARGDREGNIWLGTESGVAKLPRCLFRNYDTNIGLPGDHVISIFEDSHGNYLFGTYNGFALQRNSGDLKVYGITDGLPHPSVHDFCEDSKGNIWVATFGGLRFLSNGKLHLPPFREMENARIVRLLKDRTGTIWCGSNKRIYRIRNRTVEIVVDEHIIGNGNVSALFMDSGDTLWFGTDGNYGGYYKGGRVRSLSESDGLPHSWVMSIVEDKHGSIWFTTQKGVVLWDGGKFIPIPTNEDALRGGVVAFAVRDSLRHLWFGTQDGIFEWDDSVRGHWDMRDGLVSDPTRRGFVDGSGHVWIGTVGGVSRMDSGRMHSANDPPSVVLEGIELDDSVNHRSMRTSFDYDENTFTVHFNALSFIDEQRTEFRWILSGFDATWQPARNQRQARYTHLPAGEYEFEVCARNPHTAWSAPVHFAFIITPPLWNRWWFIGLCGSACAGIVVLVVRTRVSRLLEIERLRSRIARDLHDEIGSNLSSIAMASDLLGRHTEFGEKERGKLAEISSVALGTVKNMKDIVWLIKPGNDSIDDLFLRMKDAAATLLERYRYDLRFPNGPVGRKVDLEWRQHVYLIFKEALTNIAKHARAGTVSIVVAVEGDNLAITIEDDGKGFDSASTTIGTGLKNMQERANILKAQFTVEAPPSGGTRITLNTRIT